MITSKLLLSKASKTRQLEITSLGLPVMDMGMASLPGQCHSWQFISHWHFLEIIINAPQLYLFEQSLCSSYYRIHDPNLIGHHGWIEESYCRPPEIQHQLATVRGWKSFFDTLQLVWLSSAIQLFGGGLSVSAALMWAQASEIFLEEERSKGYYYIFSAFYIAEMVSSGLASATLDSSPWIPSALAYGSILFCLVIQLRIPQRSEQHRADSQNMGRRSPADEDLTEQENASLCREGECPKTTSFRAAFSNHNVLLVVPAFFVGSTRYTVLNVLMQYAHVRFGWIIYAAGFGSRVSTFSLVSLWISNDAKGTFYAAIAVLENIGHAIADPSLQQIFAAVLASHSASSRWLALPVFVAAASFLE